MCLVVLGFKNFAEAKSIEVNCGAPKRMAGSIPTISGVVNVTEAKEGYEIVRGKLNVALSRNRSLLQLKVEGVILEDGNLHLQTADGATTIYVNFTESMASTIERGTKTYRTDCTRK